MSSHKVHEVVDVKVSAPGKVILHGEHSVVYGKTALACSLDIRTTTQIKTATGANRFYIKLEFPDLGTSHVIPLQHVKPAINRINKLGPVIDPNTVNSIVNIIKDLLPDRCSSTEVVVFLYLYLSMNSHLPANQLPPMEVRVQSDIPIGAGLGSSAAFSVSLAGAIFHYLKKLKTDQHHLNGLSGSLPNEDTILGDSLDDSEMICQWAYNAEKIIHGNPSGLDNSICTFGGLLSYKKHPALVESIKCHDSKETPRNIIENISVPRNLRILLINTKVARNTKALVAKVGHDRASLLPKVTAHILDAMDRVSQDCKDTLAAIVNNNNVLSNNNGKKISDSKEDQENLKALFHRLEQLIDVNQGLLSALGVSHPSLDQIQSICMKEGQLHAKLTGAGGGGFAFALVTPFHPESQVASTKVLLQKEGYECWDTNIAGDGMKLHET